MMSNIKKSKTNRNLINKCKSKNIKVHAWINVYYLWSSKKHPPQNDHLFFQRPEWIDQEKGDKYILNRSYLNKDKDILINGEGFFLAPTNPDVNDYLISVISELSGNYHIDGIHYDYIRYHSLDYGYNEVGFSFFYVQSVTVETVAGEDGANIAIESQSFL